MSLTAESVADAIFVINATDTLKIESRFESIFNHVNEGILIANHQGEILLANPKVLALFGYSEDELKGQPVEILVPDQLRDRHTDHRDSYMRHPVRRPMGHNLTLFGKRKNGEQFPIEISLSYYESGEGIFIIAFIIDITERYRQQEEIRHVNEKLRQLNENLERKVNERTLVLKEALTSLEHSRDELGAALNKEKELNEMKSRFISMASHEFRTPLATILSSASLISKYQTEEEWEQREKHIVRIKSAVRNLTEILNDFLSLGKLEEGKVKANWSAIDLKDCIEELLSELQLLRKSDQQFTFTHSGETEVMLDKQLFRNVMINLVANAIKFSPDHGPISISSQVDDQGLTVSVADQGIGISKQDQEHLFERFFRAENAVNVQGTGLGLNIVLKYLELMSGHITCESELGRGTTFTFRIPKHRES